jgi:hypothetical protein
MIPVHVCWTDEEADVVVSYLRARGIDAQTTSEALRGVFALEVDGLGEVQVVVPEDRAAEARALLRDRPPEDASE